MFTEQTVGGWRTESLHRHSGMPRDNGQRFLADGVAGENGCDRHDNKGGGERTGMYQNNNRLFSFKTNVLI